MFIFMDWEMYKQEIMVTVTNVHNHAYICKGICSEEYKLINKRQGNIPCTVTWNPNSFQNGAANMVLIFRNKKRHTVT